MRIIPRLGSRNPENGRRPATAKLRLQPLEDRSLPSFGFGSAFHIGSTGYDNGHSVATDPSGNLYISGSYSGTTDFDPNGTNPTSNHVLTATGVDGDGFVAKYLANGTFQWVTDVGSETGSVRVAVGGSAVYAATSVGDSVAKLDQTSGAVIWNTTVTAGETEGIAVDPSGNVDVTGSTASGATSQAFVTQLDSAGNVRWTNTSSGGNGAGNWGTTLAVDGSGNIYATGRYAGTVVFGATSLTSLSSTIDVFVWKLNSSGGSVWAGSMGSNGGYQDSSGGIAVDGSGNVALTGAFTSSTNNFNPGSGRATTLPYHGGVGDVFIAKLVQGKNGAMTLSWAKGIGGSGVDFAGGLAFDAAGNVYTTGIFQGTVNFNPNNGQAHNLSGGGIFVSELDANGNYVAAASMAGTADGNGQGQGVGIALDGAGNVYTTGVFSGTADFDPSSGTYNLTSNGGDDIFVSKLTQSGRRPSTGGDPNLGNGPADAGVALIDSAFEPAENLKPSGVSPPITAPIVPSEGDLSFLSVSLNGNSVESQSKGDLRISLDSADSSIATDLPIVWN
jgi:hypothetical protein